jgi:hypothetical protein
MVCFVMQLDLKKGGTGKENLIEAMKYYKLSAMLDISMHVLIMEQDLVKDI